MTYRPSSITSFTSALIHRTGQISTRFTTLTGLSFATLIALTGSLGLSQSAWAETTAERVLLAQSIVDGLPPSPAFSGEQLPPPQLQPAQPTPFVTTPTSPAFQPASPAPYSSEGFDLQRYLVLVNGDSPLLLEQVRKVESGAFLQNYDGRRVIQAGSFVEPNRAQQQQQRLESQGIGAEVIAITSANSVQASGNQLDQPTAVAYNSSLPAPELAPASTSANREVIFGQQPSFDNSADVRVAQAPLTTIASSRYYVVVPGGRANLTAITDQITRLGGRFGIARATTERTAPLGPHVIVGPYANRRAAERWSRYLRAFGLDARVYYRR
jgi:hypothetical protein